MLTKAVYGLIQCSAKDNYNGQILFIKQWYDGSESVWANNNGNERMYL